MKRHFVLVTLAVATVMSLLASSVAEAVPAFARQMGVSCNTCHFEHFPMLNAFGRSFKSSGFTMITTPLIESDHFSLPANLNAALFSNIRYQKSNGPRTSNPTISTSNDGEWVIPGETSLFVAGRASENLGVLLEGDIGGAGAAAGAGFLASIKLPIVFPANNTLNVGLVPFSSGLGPAYAFELLNTGAVGNHIMTLIHPTEVSAQQYIQAGAKTTFNDYGGAAEGVGFFAVTSDYFITAAKWQPNHIALNQDNPGSAQSNSSYLRAAFTPQFGGWDFGLGVQYFGGQSALVDTAVAPATLTPVRTEALAFDAQAQGVVNRIPIGIYLSHASAPATNPGELPNLYNPNPNSKTATSIATEWGIFAGGRGTLELAYRRADDGAATNNTDNALTVGLTYLISHNIQFSILDTKYTGNAHDGNIYTLPATGSGNRLVSLNLAVGF
ncbi:MAG: hypothetical protein HY272_14695 [Gammaproteobacteria bacterium]|nr:hypothetical protein [Gammaproteobacteria bacterium]